MHLEIGFYLATLLLQKHRQKESRPKNLPERCQEARPRAGPERWRRMTVLGQQVAPHYDMAVFDGCQSRINVLLVQIGLGLRENAVEERRIGLVLPMVLKRVNVGVNRGSHRSNMPGTVLNGHRATLRAPTAVIPTRTYVNRRITMRVIVSILTGAALLGAVPVLQAQQKAPKKEKQPSTAIKPEKDGCVTRDGRTECVFRRMDFDSVMTKRPAIGVQLAATGSVRDSIGVFVSRVTPNGPAEKAGIVEGDRIVAINGVDLRLNSADAGDSYAAELPVRRLTREVGKLTPGAVATLRVWSGGRVRDVPVTVGRASDLREFGMMDGYPRGFIVPGPDMDGLRMQLRDFPRMKREEMRIPRMKLEGLRDRIRMEHLAPLRDGVRFKMLAPSRVRVFHDGDWFDDPDVIIEKMDRAKVEKEKSAKKK